MVPTMTTRAGRHFLQIPGPTNVPERVLHAIAAVQHDVLPGPPKPGRLRLLREAGVTLRGKG